MAFIKRCVSKIASSPTKNGEYLACGLPLIINAGIGDSDALINDWKAGVLIEDLTEEEYAEAGAVSKRWWPAGGSKELRGQSLNNFSICKQIGVERYAALYERVY